MGKGGRAMIEALIARETNPAPGQPCRSAGQGVSGETA
jgi:hypothetical protein